MRLDVREPGAADGAPVLCLRIVWLYPAFPIDPAGAAARFLPPAS
jgi:hypothetical protein